MKAKLFGIVAFMLIAVFAGAVSALPTIDRVDIDDTTVFENQINRLDIEVGNSIDVEVWLNSDAEYRNVQVEAEITGYEHDDLSDKTELFDTEADATYKKNLRISLPEDVDKDSYQLRIILTDRNSGAVIQNYNLLLDRARHSMVIEDVTFYPENAVTAGQALLATVRVENFGQKDEDNVKVHVSLPELGSGAWDVIDEVESDDQEGTEEMYIRIDPDVETGEYTVLIEVEYNDGHSVVSQTDSISILAKPAPTVTQVVVQPPVDPVEPTTPVKSTLRSILEGILLVLVGLLVVVAIILGVSKLGSSE